MRTGRPRVVTDEVRRRIVELLPTMSYSAVAQKAGVSTSSVCAVAHKEGLVHTRDERRAYLSQYRSGIMRRERWRVENGIRQETKYPINILPRRTNAAKNRLHYAYGYIKPADTNSVTMYYDETTARATPATEQYYTDRYGIRFVGVTTTNEEPEETDEDDKGGF